ncbi:tRNA uridine(34) 5-carboxymethylaminomethyl modification radical SAM/GNAT enzyme Elp3 [Candidatus Bathyarchaeota archaeon]|nr:MAG: tRNA uridine(34) 5-carboxymethylaminomethyl modification radical SAM/GNAT enzyme Elp3 [Candidatus Bathyarchaeota archaeon]
MSNLLPPSIEQLSEEIVEQILTLQNPSREAVNRVKLNICKKHRSPVIPPNSSILERLPEEDLARLHPFLQGKQVRSISGVTVVAVMPKPYGCPHGKCTYCPGGPEVGVPRAYTGKEPAVMRALETEYDPARQVKSRMNQLEAIGHRVDKVELILIGGTFPFLPRIYQEEFVKECLDTLNGTKSESLEEAKMNAETAHIRNVGITIETRPDWSRQGHVDHMLSMGVTRVEIGVQTLYDDVYQRIHRDHTVADVEDAARTLRDSSLKVGYHMMLGLPGCDRDRDLTAFQRLWDDPAHRPDMLKIYPCLVTPGTQLYEDWRSGKYQPYRTEEAARLIAEIKKVIPPWVRIMRIQREIPADGIADGVKNGNLRQLVQEELSRQSIRCRCIRCREVGHSSNNSNETSASDNIGLQKTYYEASGGSEVFLSFENREREFLVGYVRLRIPSETAHRFEIKGKQAGLVRELHIFGQTVPVGDRPWIKGYQHKGYGSQLLQEAERIATEEYDCRKMLVISALGTKQYYAKFGYARDGPYVSKTLS